MTAHTLSATNAVSTTSEQATPAASCKSITDAYETIRGIVYELAGAIGPARALAQLKLLLANTKQGSPESGVTDAAICEIAQAVEYDTRENLSAETTIEVIQEIVASWDVELRSHFLKAA
jgi:hypothetical protein